MSSTETTEGKKAGGKKTKAKKAEGKKAGEDAPPVSIGWDSHQAVVRVIGKMTNLLFNSFLSACQFFIPSFFLYTHFVITRLE